MEFMSFGNQQSWCHLSSINGLQCLYAVLNLSQIPQKIFGILNRIQQMKLCTSFQYTLVPGVFQDYFCIPWCMGELPFNVGILFKNSTLPYYSTVNLSPTDFLTDIAISTLIETCTIWMVPNGLLIDPFFSKSVPIHSMFENEAQKTYQIDHSCTNVSFTMHCMTWTVWKTCIDLHLIRSE